MADTRAGADPAEDNSQVPGRGAVVLKLQAPQGGDGSHGLHVLWCPAATSGPQRCPAECRRRAVRHAARALSTLGAVALGPPCPVSAARAAENPPRSAGQSKIGRVGDPCPPWILRNYSC